MRTLFLEVNETDKRRCSVDADEREIEPNRKQRELLYYIVLKIFIKCA
jgi:hypothetical protein